MQIQLFDKKKSADEKIHMVTCYDHWSAKVLNETAVDCLLVGDSCAMVMHGFKSTVSATMPMMVMHTAAVARGAKQKFIVADMPFGSFRKSVEAGVEAAMQLMQAGAHAVKLEGVRGHEELVSHLVGTGIPVMGHLGLTPQSVNCLGGYKVQGRTPKAAEAIFEDAKTLESLGCFALVLECVPSPLAKRISEELKIPTIGIGAGPDTDGQVLVLQDLLGAQHEMQPKFLKTYCDLEKTVKDAVNAYCNEVTTGVFPSVKESYE